MLGEERLHRLVNAAQTLVAEHDLDAVLERLLGVARELTAARYAAIGVLDERRESLADFITAGIDADTHAAIGELPHGRGVLGLLISNPEPLRLKVVGEHVRSCGFPAAHPSQESSAGFGLGGIRERIALIGGELQLTSTDEGTTVAARLPAAARARHVA